MSASGLDEGWDQRICEAVADLLVISMGADGTSLEATLKAAL